MRLSKLLALALFAMLAMAAAQVRADPPSAEDLVVCCDLPSTEAAAAGQGCGWVPGCVVIDGSPNSINRCKGLVVGCAERSFKCVTDGDGTKSCTCAGFQQLCGGKALEQ
jgi:hypothetical protein